MKTWLTEIRAIDPIDGELKTWAGPKIQAETFEDAEKCCEENGLGYCVVIGELIFECSHWMGGKTNLLLDFLSEGKSN